MPPIFEIPIIFQDEHIIVVNKPVDLPVHKNDFMPHDAAYLTKLIGELTGNWIFNVHRLDSKTSGIIVLAFSSEIAHKLTLSFERREVKKTYYAIVQGNPGNGVFDRKVVVKKKSVFKKPAVTKFQTLKSVTTKISYKDKKDFLLGLVEVFPETGRWHQIRQHFSQYRFDILGDTQHGDFTLNKIIAEITGINRLFLHAGKLAFVHPVTNEYMTFETGLPQDFTDIIEYDWKKKFLTR